MDPNDGRKHNIGHNRPHAGPEPSFTTSTTYHSSTSRSFTGGSSVGVSIGSSSPPEGPFRFPHHGTGSSITGGSTFGASTTYGCGLGSGVMSRRGPSTYYEDTAPPHLAHSDASKEKWRDMERDMERSERQCKIFAATLVTLFLTVVLWAMLTGSGDGTGSDSGSGSGGGKTNSSSSSWTLWIPLGPLSIGYGSEGFQWSVQFWF